MGRLIVIRTLPGFGLLVAGAVIVVLWGTSTVAFAVGISLVGLGTVALVSIFFYEVGRSEDRDRAREQRAGRGSR